MLSNLRKYAFALVALLLLSTCSKVPDGILSEKRMQSVLKDMLLAESMTNIDYSKFRSDTMKVALFESVFRKHGITKADYDSSLMWYGRNLDIFMKVYDRTLKDINNSITALGDVQADAAPVTNQDSVNIWPRRSYSTFYPSSPFNAVVFNIKPETAYSSGSSFVLGLRVWGLDNKRLAKPEIRLCAEQPDTTVVLNHKISYDGYHTLVLKSAPTKRVNRVYGFIRYENSDSSYYKVYLDSLSLIRYNYGREGL